LKIYTRTGDYGETGLFAGPRVGKEHPRIEAYGAIDELAAVLGMVRSAQPPQEIDEVLARIQHELFIVGGELATPTPERREMKTVQPEHIQQLEQDIDRFDAQLPELKNFVLSGGSKAGATLHLARATCRRAERRAVALARRPSGRVSRDILAYLNRLGDMLFVLARAANAAAGHPEEKWPAEPEGEFSK
jgi:cob(I)alamin adenosyltransferase